MWADTAREWSVAEYELASAIDALNGANWQRSGSKGTKPKPLPRPGEKAGAEAKRQLMYQRGQQFRNRQGAP